MPVSIDVWNVNKMYVDLRNTVFILEKWVLKTRPETRTPAGKKSTP